MRLIRLLSQALCLFAALAFSWAVTTNALVGIPEWETVKAGLLTFGALSLVLWIAIDFSKEKFGKLGLALVLFAASGIFLGMVTRGIFGS